MALGDLDLDRYSRLGDLRDLERDLERDLDLDTDGLTKKSGSQSSPRSRRESREVKLSGGDCSLHRCLFVIDLDSKEKARRDLRKIEIGLRTELGEVTHEA